MPSPHNIVMLGAGAWGTSVATLMAYNRHNILIWCLEPEVANSINNEHENKQYLPGIKLPHTIKATTNLDEACNFSTLLFEAIPIAHLRAILNQVKLYIKPDHQFVILSKGMEDKTSLLPTQIIQTIFGEKIDSAVIAGPTFARDLAQQKLSAASISSSNPKFLQKICTLTRNEYFKPIPTNDFIGVQLCATYKNIMALMIGIAHGAGYSENTRAFLLTYGLHELQKLITYFKGIPTTAYDLCGIGDLLLTTCSTQSRNLKTGMLLGQKKSLLEIEHEFKHLPEGINSTLSIHDLCKATKLNLPLAQGVYNIIFNKLSPESFIKNFTMQMHEF